MTVRRTVAAALTALALLTTAAPAQAATRRYSATVTTVVPSVLGLDREAATYRVHRAHLRPYVTIQKGSDSGYPLVTRFQMPAAGTRLPAGAVVTIVLGE